MKVREVSLEEAVGLPLSHDLTQVWPETKFKGPRFSRGHVVTREDFAILRDMGREHLSVLDLDPSEVHEDDAALALALSLAGSGVEIRGPREGKCSLLATHRGLLRFDPDTIHALNEDLLWSVVTLPPRMAVEAGQEVAACRIMPLAMDKDRVDRACDRSRPLEVLPFRPLGVGLVTTGRELAEGRIPDAFMPKLEKKLYRYGGHVVAQRYATDDPDRIVGAIEELIALGATMVLCTGGMSVDADDRTPGALRRAGDRVCFQGVPMMPGNMLMLALRGDIPLVGAPACVAYDERTSLDPLMDLLAAGIYPTAEEVRRWGVGGLCLRCPSCAWPRCSFGSGA